MIWIFLAVVVILLIIWRIKRSSSPAVIAEKVAKDQLIRLHELETKHPEAERVKLYMQSAMHRPGYDSFEKVEALFDFARTLSEQRDGVWDAEVNYMWLVTAIAVSEYTKGESRISGEDLTRIYRTVSRLIPENI